MGGGNSVIFKNLQAKLPNFLVQWLGYARVRRLLWSVLFFFIVMGIFSLHFLPERIPLEAGQVSPRDIPAERYLTFVDENETEKKKLEMAQSVQDVYSVHPEVLQKTLDEISSYFKKVMGVVINPAISQEEKKTILKEFNWSLKDKQWEEIIRLEPGKIEALEVQTKSIVEKIFIKGVNKDSLKFSVDKIMAEVELLEIKPAYRELIKSILKTVEFKPNLLYDPVLTEEKRSKAREEVEPVHVVIKKGQNIVREGDVLTQRQVDILTWLGYKNNVSPWVIISGLAFFIALLMIMMSLYLRQYRRDLYRDENKLFLLMLLVAITILLTKFFLSINLSQIPERAEQVGNLVPVAAGSMLIAILLDTNLAIFIAAILATIVGIMTGQVAFAITAFTGAVIGVYVVSSLNQRSDLAKAGLWIALGNTVSVLALGLINNVNWSVILTGVGFAIGNGILSSVLTIGILPYLESGFGITTSVRLLEISNPNHPLLKKLLLETPGTYHHSILVGNLAEAAADAVGADTLLVRAGAYYHDIGKIKRPYFFVENQMNVENPHEKITASLSTLIITSHVKDGVELAKEYGIPKVVIDMIAQHHGTSLIKFFYHKAKETEKEDTVKEEDFRYPGPKPQKKEMAIIMLADSIEAAVRSIKAPTPGKIEGMIRNIIKDRLNDGQLDECDLTFKDLDEIANAFVRVLSGIYHTRIEYPDNNMLKGADKGKKKGEKDGSNNEESTKQSKN